MDDKCIEFLKRYGLYNEEILKYIESRTKRLDYSTRFLSFFGCFPKFNDHGRLIDMRMCVPYFINDITRSIICSFIRYISSIKASIYRT